MYSFENTYAHAWMDARMYFTYLRVVHIHIYMYVYICHTYMKICFYLFILLFNCF
jgi:hypothetical protein